MQPSLSKVLHAGVVDERCRRAKRIKLEEDEVVPASRRTVEAEIVRGMFSDLLCTISGLNT